MSGSGLVCGMDVPQVIGWLVGVSMVPVVIYALVQRLRHPRRNVTAKGLLVAAFIGASIAYPGLRKRMSGHENARASSKPTLVSGCRRSCVAQGAPAPDCAAHCACVLRQLEARHPTPDAWSEYLQLAATNPIMAQTEAMEASVSCRPERPPQSP